MSAAATSAHIDFVIHGGVATLTLRRSAKRNAVTAEMWEAILEHLATARERTDVHVLAIRGSDGVFSAGADLAAVKDEDGQVSVPFNELSVRALTAIAEFPVPSVALVEGPCIGGGCAIALACDLRFAHPNASFGVPAVRHGIVYDPAALVRLVELVGPGQAARFVYTAERIDGARAAEIGLVEECSADLDGLLADFVSHVVLGDRATVAATRSLLRRDVVDASVNRHA